MDEKRLTGLGDLKMTYGLDRKRRGHRHADSL